MTNNAIFPQFFWHVEQCRDGYVSRWSHGHRTALVIRETREACAAATIEHLRSKRNGSAREGVRSF